MNRASNIPFNKWELLLSTSEKDFHQCFNLCYDDLYRLGLYLYKNAELAKECIQLLFIELWKIKDRLADVKNLKEYVLTIFKRILYKQKTGSVKHWSQLVMIDAAMVGEEHYTESYEDMLVAHQESQSMQNKLLQALPLLAQRQKELIMLRYFQEKSIEEIANITLLTPRTIYNTLHNALARLKEMMG
ncbi:MAG: sigma-70 family RNA polymerase sigma factor [Gloeobacteraceae cyanobacterium ES-bin-316]|nr:sigma-70 family RNA polymerase sigma factor [Ferruginibacter sp.]